MAKQYDGPHGQTIVFNGDWIDFPSTDGQILYSPERTAPEPLYYVLRHGTASDHVLGGRGRHPQVMKAKQNVHSTYDDSPGVIEIDNDKDTVVYRDEVYHLARKVTFDPTVHQVIGKPVSGREMLCLWRVDDEEDAYIALVSDGTPSKVFYIDGEEIYPDREDQFLCDVVPDDVHLEGLEDCDYRFAGSRKLHVSCLGDTFVNSTLTRMDVDDYTISFDEKGCTIDIARKA